jgi:elongation factor P
MIGTGDFREGLIFLDENGELVEIIEYQHHRKSQARAVVRVKLKNLNTGSIIESSYRPEDKFREVSIEKRTHNYIYAEGDMLYFMDASTFEQIGVPSEKIGHQRHYLVDNMEVIGLFIDDKLFNIILPIKVDLRVASTVPGVRGDTVSNLTKPATLESGLEIKVPLFINEGDKIRIDTRTDTYLERVNG